MKPRLRLGQFAQSRPECDCHRPGAGRQIHRGVVGTLMRLKSRLLLLKQTSHLFGKVRHMKKAAPNAVLRLSCAQETVETGIAQKASRRIRDSAWCPSC